MVCFHFVSGRRGGERGLTPRVEQSLARPRAVGKCDAAIVSRVDSTSGAVGTCIVGPSRCQYCGWKKLRPVVLSDVAPIVPSRDAFPSAVDATPG